jgi:STE24 endopeptidase
MNFDAAAATAGYMASLTPDALARSNACFEGGYWLLLKLHPGPVEEFVFFDHPSGWNRIQAR